MNVHIHPGTYILAVSGGIDSMVLLDILSKHKDTKLVVAHFDHGIRPDSKEDSVFVGNAAKRYDLPYVFGTAALGPRASEEQARDARYSFLKEQAKKNNANGIITAHHQDDFIETALLNMLRGTGRKGLTSMAGSTDIIRPLLSVPKASIRTYAKQHKILWREDPTNEDTNYFRNYIRKHIVPKLTIAQRLKLVTLLNGMTITNKEIDREIANYLHFSDKNTHVMDKSLVVNLNHSLACEAIAEWLRNNNIRDFDKNLIERIVIAVKTYKAGQKTAIAKGKYLYVGKRTIEII